ncbi:MAG: methionyl-tRNA formyltransferase, partial [Sphingomicrobium sp.]
TGPMLLKRAVEIEDKNAAQLTEELAKFGASMMVDVLADLPGFEPIPQPEEGVTYAAKVKKDEARIDWSRPAAELVRHIQGLAPFPGAWFEVDGERIKILAATAESSARLPREIGGPASSNDAEAKRGSRFRGKDGLVLDDSMLIQCGTDAIRPVLVQRSGKGAMSTEELLRGFPIPAGTTLQ